MVASVQVLGGLVATAVAIEVVIEEELVLECGWQSRGASFVRPIVTVLLGAIVVDESLLTSISPQAIVS